MFRAMTFNIVKSSLMYGREAAEPQLVCLQPWDIITFLIFVSKKSLKHL